MAFAIEISEVGEAEYPLLETLRDSIFREFGHESRSPIAAGLSHRHDLYVLIAHLEGNPLGFAVGYSRGPMLFYLNYLGVLSDYRRQGVGMQLLQRQEAFARSRGYPQMQFNTFNHFLPMIRLGLSQGYLPVGAEQHFGTWWDLSIRFEKALDAQAHPPSADPPAAQQLVHGEIRISADNLPALRDALDRGFRFAGMVHEAGRFRPMVILREVSGA